MSCSPTALPRSADLGVVELRGEPPAGHVDDDAVDLDARHPLGGVDGEADRVLGGVEIDDRAGLDAARALMADAQHLAAMGAPAQRVGALHRRQPRDQADDLRGADVEHRKHRALARGNLPHARRQRLERSWRGALLRRAPRRAPRPPRRTGARRPCPASRRSSDRMSRSRMRDWRCSVEQRRASPPADRSRAA